MSTRHWSRIKSLFADAVDLGDEERNDFLRRACGPDEALRRDVESLLSAHARDDEFLVPPAASDVTSALGGRAAPLRPGDRLGSYQLLELVAEGGMGAVHRGRRADDLYEKEVAIKIVRHGLVTPSLRERFHRERQTLAQLEHPGITRLIDGGTTPSGLPWLAMELVDGRPIDRFCDDEGLDRRARIRLFRQICDAVQAAHRNLVVHRDLKPANILVTDDGRVKLLDFGIAGLLEPRPGEPDAFTKAPAQPRALTPDYASPEQLRGKAVTTATDVYALGVVLYELLTGRRPHDLAGLPRHEMERIVCETEPPAPSVVTARGRRSTEGDLDLIVLTALHHDPAQRYASVEHLSDDLDRWMRGLPIRARTSTLGYRLSRFAGRHRWHVTTAALAALLLVAAVIATTVGLVRSRRAEQVAVRERGAAREVLAFYQDMLLRTNPFRTGRNLDALELLAEAGRAIETDLAGHPGLEAGVRVAVGRSYANLMRWDLAAPHLERALPLLRAAPDIDAEALADCLALLGRARCHLARPGGVALQKEGLRIRRRRFGAEHPLVAESLGNLGYALWTDRGRPRRTGAAEQHYLASLAMFDRLGASACRDAARVTLSLGFLYAAQGRADEAEARYRRAIDLYAHLPVTEDLYEVTVMELYAQLLEQERRPAEAALLLERLLDRIPTDFAFRRRHRLMWKRSRLLAMNGEHEAALASYREALALECELVGERPGADTERLARCAAALHAPAGTVPLVEVLGEALDATRDSRGHPTTPSPDPPIARVLDLVDPLCAAGERSVARTLLRRDLATAEAELPQSHPVLERMRMEMRRLDDADGDDGRDSDARVTR